EHPALHGMKQALRWANPLLVLLAAAAVAWGLARAWRRDHAVVPFLLVAGSVLAVTLVHSVLQAEPRYAIPFRPLLLLLIVTTAAWTEQRLRPEGVGQN